MATSSPTHDRYQAAAQQTYHNLRYFFSHKGDGSIWPYGNVFDSMADFLMLTNQAADPCFLLTVYNSFNLGGSMYDDFCWPGIAALKAFDKRYEQVFQGSPAGASKSYIQLFQDYALGVWNVVLFGGMPGNGVGGTSSIPFPGNCSNWPPGSLGRLRYTSNTKYGTQRAWYWGNKNPFCKEFAPRFPGGSWQGDMPTGADCSNLNKACAFIGAYQMSVMNGLFLVFASRVGKPSVKSKEADRVRKATREAQHRQMDFLLNWFGQVPGPERPDFNDALLSFDSEWNYARNDYGNGVLVRERVSTYANGKRVTSYSPNRFWAGDQGLQLGGLIEQKAQHHDVAIDIAIAIIKGVKNRLSYKTDKGFEWICSCSDDGQPNCKYDPLPYCSTYQQGCPGSWPRGLCPQCYSRGGVGIFMRSLLSALMDGEPRLLDYLTSPEFKGFMRKVAEYAVTAPKRDAGEITCAFEMLDYLATLNVALYYEKVLHEPL